MLPLDRVLHRIKWDPEFGSGTFAIGYYDRVLDREEIVPFAQMTLDSDRPGAFTFTDDDGTVRAVPLHRVRTVYKDGAVIWRRPEAPLGPSTRSGPPRAKSSDG